MDNQEYIRELVLQWAQKHDTHIAILKIADKIKTEKDEIKKKILDFEKAGQ